MRLIRGVERPQPALSKGRQQHSVETEQAMSKQQQDVQLTGKASSFVHKQETQNADKENSAANFAAPATVRVLGSRGPRSSSLLQNNGDGCVGDGRKNSVLFHDQKGSHATASQAPVVPRLNLENLGFLHRVAEGEAQLSKPVSARIKELRPKPSNRSSRHHPGAEYSVSSQGSVESGNDFSSHAEAMEDEELKYILRRQYKKVGAYPVLSTLALLSSAATSSR
jgi:hypothetical protein